MRHAPPEDIGLRLRYITTHSEMSRLLHSPRAMTPSHPRRRSVCRPVGRSVDQARPGMRRRNSLTCAAAMKGIYRDNLHLHSDEDVPRRSNCIDDSGRLPTPTRSRWWSRTSVDGERTRYRGTLELIATTGTTQTARNPVVRHFTVHRFNAWCPKHHQNWPKRVNNFEYIKLVSLVFNGKQSDCLVEHTRNAQVRLGPLPHFNEVLPVHFEMYFSSLSFSLFSKASLIRRSSFNAQISESVENELLSRSIVGDIWFWISNWFKMIIANRKSALFFVLLSFSRVERRFFI